MRHSFAEVDRNTGAYARIDTQPGLPGLIGAISDMQLLPMVVVQKATFNGLLSEACRHSGKDDQEIAVEIHISQGYCSRFMRGLCFAWAKRFVAFMRCTRSLAPLQWVADQVGCDLVPRSSKEAEIAELRARARELGVQI